MDNFTKSPLTFKAFNTRIGIYGKVTSFCENTDIIEVTTGAGSTHSFGLIDIVLRAPVGLRAKKEIRKKKSDVRFVNINLHESDMVEFVIKECEGGGSYTQLRMKGHVVSDPEHGVGAMACTQYGGDHQTPRFVKFDHTIDDIKYVGRKDVEDFSALSKSKKVKTKKKKTTKSRKLSAMGIHCCGCGKEVIARLTKGVEVYPHRSDLFSIPFWKCDTCNNFVGCHHKTSNKTAPLGCIPTPEIKNARQHIHKLIDPIWKSGKMTRNELYRSISEVMGTDFHTAKIKSVEEARHVYRVAKAFA